MESRTPFEKLDSLKSLLEDMKSVIVAFSGGVDSSFLLKVAVDALGGNAVGVTATSSTYPHRELEDALDFGKKIGARHITVESEELDIPGFRENPPDRCYYCKKELFSKLLGIASRMGLRHVVDGNNVDDLGDYRPGRKAAEELGVRSPLIEAEMRKDDIRFLSKELGLPTWNKGAFACLSSRFPYGTEIKEEELRKVERCEDFLREKGFRQFRVRFHGSVARIEMEEDEIQVMMGKKIRREIANHFKEEGFTFVSLDIEGYRTGSMNETIKHSSEFRVQSSEITRNTKL
jgi:uncharacterized protein